MPAAAAKKWPPKNCPVCQQTLSASEHAGNVYEAWTFYKSHLHANHPEFEIWNKRASWIYLVSIALIILPLVAGVGSLVPPNATYLVFELSWASMLGSLVVAFAIKSSGKRRFRRLWNEQHSGTVTPL